MTRTESQHIRPLQDRHRPVEFAYGRADARGPAVRARACADDGLLPGVAAGARSCTARWARPARGTAATRPCCSGSQGDEPDTVDVEAMRRAWRRSRSPRRVRLLGEHEVGFTEGDLEFHRRAVPALPPQRHALHRLDDAGRTVRAATYYSVGGGFVVDEAADDAPADGRSLPTPLACLTRSRAAPSCCDARARVRPAASPADAAQRKATGAAAPRSRPGCLEIWR